MPFRAVVGSTPITIHTGCRPLRWCGKLGLTLGSRIFLAPSAPHVWTYLLAHEFGHVLQWQGYGTVGFLYRYLRGLIAYGYGLKHPMEREAHQYEAHWAAHPAIIGAVQAMGGLV